MTITREQLEHAALAAGYEVVCTEAAFHGTDDHVKLYGGGLLLCGVQDPWRPHLDDGDAARLQVDMSMNVRRTGDGWEASIPYLLPAVFSASCDLTAGGSRAAWREAVVLCAAAAGERMQLAQRTNATPEQVAGSLQAVDEFDAAKRGER